MSNVTHNRWFTIVILLLLTANIATLALLWTTRTNKQPSVHFPPPGGGRAVFEFLTNELQLDSSQQIAYARMRDEHQAGARRLQENIRQAKDAMFALLKQANMADSLVSVYSHQAAEAQQELDAFTFRHFQKLRAICNKEQQEKFDKVIQDALHQMGGPPPGRQGPPPPGMRPGDGPPPPGN